MSSIPFHNAKSSATLLNLSERHFKRLAIEAGVPGLNFGQGQARNFKWTTGMLDKIRAYIGRAKEPVKHRKLSLMPKFR